MKLHNLKPVEGSIHKKKRVGRGPSSGKGKTSGRGMKGQHAREQVPQGFEGGQTPLVMRLPLKRGTTAAQHNLGIFRKDVAVVNVGKLARFEAGSTVTPEDLYKANLARKTKDGVKILGQGELDKALTVKAHAFSESAKAKIEAAGGSVEVIE